MSLTRAGCRRLVAAALLACVLLPFEAAAQQIDWTRVPPSGPSSRTDTSMVYDSVAGKMIMFGGYEQNFNLTKDIWEYDGAAKKWANVSPAPGIIDMPPRQGPAMAYDPVSRSVIMFGGLSVDAIGHTADTWEWNTVTRAWTRQFPAMSPAGRTGARMVYDAENRRMVLFGGSNSTTVFQDTWVWDLTAHTWSQLAPAASPAARTYHGMAYNPSNSRVTLFGGIGYPCAPGAPSCGGVDGFSDLWEFTGTTWVLIAPGGSGPRGRSAMGMAYDPAADRMVIYGGRHSEEPQFALGDTWTFSGGVWTPIYEHPNSPPGGRIGHALAYDTARNTTVTFGGDLADVWELAGNTWAHAVTLQWPPGSSDYAMAYDSDRDLTWLRGAGAQEVWEFSNPTSSWQSFKVDGPSRRRMTAVVYEQPRRKMILFGGRTLPDGTSGSVFGDTWEWDTTGRRWTDVTPRGSPPARAEHAMAYDPAHNQVVMFGGTNTASRFGDTWLWNGRTWTNVSSARGPSPRSGHAMAYHSGRRTVVLFGGADSSFLFNDIWEWNGDTLTWVEVTPDPHTAPAPRFQVALAPFDTTSGGLLMYGGDGRTGRFGDGWVWTGADWRQAPIPGTAPGRLSGAKAIYNTGAHRVLLFGGSAENGTTADIWLATVTPLDQDYAKPVQVTPSQAQGSAQTFIALYRESGTPVNQLWFLINTSVNYVGGVLVYHQPGTNQLLLRNDANTAWLTGTIGSGSLSNGQVTLDLSAATVSSAEGVLAPREHRLSLPLYFKPAFDGRKNIYMFTADADSRSAPDGWRLMGTYLVNLPNTAPATVSVTPSSGTGMSQRFAAVYRDGNGPSDLQQTFFLINTTTSGINGVHLRYLPAENRLYLRDNADSSWGSGTVPGSAGTLSNGQVSINASQVTVTKTATDLTLSVPLGFTAGFAGRKNLYLFAVDFQGATAGSGYQRLGTFTVAPTQTRRTDVDGDGRADLTVFRPSSGEWFVRKSRSNYSYADFLSLQWGVDGDAPLAADFDGDGMLDLTVFRPSTCEWFVRYSSTGYSYAFVTYQWGLPTTIRDPGSGIRDRESDVPLVADFDGDGRTDLAVYRPSTGEWLIRTSSSGYSYAYLTYQWGVSDDRPIPADFDGDGKADLAVYRPSTGEWFVRFSSSSYSYEDFATYSWGVAGDLPLLSDFDGDGRTDLVVYRPSDSTWHVRFSSSEYSFADWTSFQWGVPGDLPLAGDFDGDGKTDLTVFRPASGEWFIRYSSVGYSYSGFGTYQWGIGGDVPMMPR